METPSNEDTVVRLPVWLPGQEMYGTVADGNAIFKPDGTIIIQFADEKAREAMLDQMMKGSVLGLGFLWVRAPYADIDKGENGTGWAGV